MLGAGLLMATGGADYDTDAQTYIAAVEAADGQSLESGVKDAINALFVGCKADETFAALKTSCLWYPSRTLAGALVPLAGSAITNTGFSSGDYTREIGLLGGFGKSINTNWNYNTVGQNDHHVAFWNTYIGGGSLSYPVRGATQGASGTSEIVRVTSAGLAARNRSSTSDVIGSSGAFATGFIGHTRSASTGYTVLTKAASDGTETTYSVTRTSQAPASTNMFIFNGWDGRIAFYSGGSNTNLALLARRVSTALSAIAAAIP